VNPGNVASVLLRYVSGVYRDAGSTLYVSNGLGLTGPPIRLAAAPEIVRVGLTARRV
jgi:predicted MPP superfamily phosphohydrolase